MLSVVCVDDSELELGVVNGIARRVGLTVDALEMVGTTGLASIRRFRPTFAILDVVLPGITGSEILKVIIEEQIPTIPIMATSMVMMKEQCKELGAVHFLSKPYNPILAERELRAIVEAEQAARG